MENYIVVPSLFFDNHRAFPWDVLGYGIPKWGQPHSYVCAILAPLANRIEKPLLAANPTMREVGRLARLVIDGNIPVSEHEAPFVTPDIHRFFSEMYDWRKEHRKETAQEVLDCLRKFGFYQKYVRDRLTYLWKQNLITIPRQYLTVAKSGEKNEGSYRW